MAREAAPSPEPRWTRGSSVVSSENQEVEKACLDLGKQLSETPPNNQGTIMSDDDDEYDPSSPRAEEDPEFPYSLEDLLYGWSVPPSERMSRLEPMIRFGQSLTSLFRRWCQVSSGQYPMYWWRRLLSMFRFALRRPLMPNRKLHHCLKALGVKRIFLRCKKDQQRQNTRSRKWLIGIDPNGSTAAHPSSEYMQRLREIQHGSCDSQDETETIRQRLHSVSASFKAGEIDKKSALGLYRAILGTTQISDYDLAWRLESFGLSTADSIATSPGFDEGDCEAIEGIVLHITAYRSNDITLEAATTAISEELVGLKTDHDVLARYVTNQQWSEYETAKQIWIWSLMETPIEPLEDTEDIGATMIQGSTLEAIADRFAVEYGGQIGSGLDPGLALTEYREEINVEDFSPAQISYILRHVEHRQSCQDMDKNKDTEPNLENDTKDATALAASSMLPPAIPATQSQNRDATSSNNSSVTASDGCATETPIGSSNCTASKENAQWEDAFDGTASNPQARDHVGLSSSPEEGFSDSLFGLILPTTEARDLGRRIGLPTDYVRTRIRSSTPRRLSARKIRKSSITVNYGNQKRKASSTIHQGRRLRTQRKDRESCPFAGDGEDRETLVPDNSSACSRLSRAGKQLQFDPPPKSGNAKKENGFRETPLPPATPRRTISETGNAAQNERLGDVDAAMARPSSQLASTSKSSKQPVILGTENRKPDTVFKHLKTRILGFGAFDSAHSRDRLSLTSIAHHLIHELEDATRRGEVEEPRSDKDVEAIILLTLVAKTPVGLSIAALVAALSGDESKASNVAPDHSVFHEGTQAHTLLSCYRDSLSDSHNPSIGSAQSLVLFPQEPSSGHNTPSSTHWGAKASELSSWVDRPIRLRPRIWHLESLILPTTLSALRSSLKTIQFSTSGDDPPGNARWAPDGHQHSSLINEGAVRHQSKEHTSPSYSPPLELPNSSCQYPINKSSDLTKRMFLEDTDSDRPEADRSQGPASNSERESSSSRRKHAQGFKPSSHSSDENVVESIESATGERESSFVMSETLRSQRILANASVVDNRYFQNSSSSSPTGSSNALNRLFDKYRGELSSS